MGRDAVQMVQEAFVFAGVVDGDRPARGRGRADDALAGGQSHELMAVAARRVQLGDAAGLDDHFAGQGVDAKDGDRVEAEGAAGQADDLFQHVVQFISGVHLAGDLGDKFQVGGAGALVGKEAGVGDGRGGLIGQNGQTTQILFAEVIGAVALGSDDAQRAPGGQERQEESRARWTLAVVGRPGRQAIHLALEVAH
jgi:hypothetical protein